MSESIYNQAQNRILVLYEILESYELDLKNGLNNIYEKYGLGIHSPCDYTIEFDQFKIEFPQTHKKYLQSFLDQYEALNQYYSEMAYYHRDLIIGYLSSCIKEIIFYLKGLLNPENEIQEKSQKFEKLGETEKILIFYYLNEKNKMFKYPLNSKSGKHFLSRLLDINPVSIKNPVLKISDYTTNQVTERQALDLYPRLQKVKTFFDNSELFEISKVIETRINVLKQKAGKD